MIRHHTLEEVTRYNWFKIITTIILILLLLVLSWRQCCGSGATDEPTMTSADETGTSETAVTPPTTPTLDIPTITGLPSDGTTALGAVALTGTGSPGSTVHIMADGDELGQAVVDGNGRWQTTLNLDKAGSYDFQLEARDDQGQIAKGTPFQLTVPDPTLEIIPPTFTLPAGDLQPGKLALSGLGTPGSTVDVLVDGVSVGTADVGDDGRWAFDLDLNDPGDFEVGVRALDATGQIVADGDSYPLNLSLPIEAPTLTLPDGDLLLGDVTLQGTGTPGSVVEVLLGERSLGTAVIGDDGTWTFDTTLTEQGDYTLTTQAVGENGQAIQTGEGRAISIASPIVPSVDITADDLFTPGPIQLQGQGEPGATVEILLDGEPIGTAVVAADGTWQLETNIDTAGQHTIGVRTISNNGDILVEGTPADLTVATAPIFVDLPELPDRAGRFFSLLQNYELPEGVSETDTFTLFAPTDSAFQQLPESVLQALLDNPDALRRVVSHHIVTGTVELGDEPQTLKTLAGTEITIQPTETGYEVDGSLITDVVESDSGQVYFVENLLVPSTEGITPPTIDESGIPTYKGSFLTVVGLAEPNTTLVLLVNGQQVGTTVVDADGFWLVEYTIEDGRYVIIAYLLDENGLPLITSKPIILVNPGPLAK